MRQTALQTCQSSCSKIIVSIMNNHQSVITGINPGINGIRIFSGIPNCFNRIPENKGFFKRCIGKNGILLETLIVCTLAGRYTGKPV